MKIFPVIVENITGPRAGDKTWKISLRTQELSPDERKAVTDLAGEFCYAALKKEDFVQSEKEAMSSLHTDFENKSKSPSQRLRAVMYILFKQDNEGQTDFEVFYRAKLEKVIDHFKGKILD